MSRNSRDYNFSCPETCTAYHARQVIEKILGIGCSRVYQLVHSGDLVKGRNGSISCQSARRYAFDLESGKSCKQSDTDKPDRPQLA